MTPVISFSGGRTSAYLLHLMMQFNKDIPCVFMDTGAEHPNTYQFIRDIYNKWQPKLTLLRVSINKTHGEGSTYRRIDINDVRCDYEPWKAMLKKYGHPYVGGAFCTDRMKTKPFTVFCEDYFGKGQYETWLGIRYDEPARLWGEDLFKAMKASGVSNESASSVFCKAIHLARSLNSDICYTLLQSQFGTMPFIAEGCQERIAFIMQSNLRYLAEMSTFDKQDVLDWWEEQPFDLDLEEHKGNCVFCIKKSLQKVALAAKDEPGMADEFWKVLAENDKKPDKVMYRSNSTLQEVIVMFDDSSRSELASRMRSMRQYDTGSCSESCEAFK